MRILCNGGDDDDRAKMDAAAGENSMVALVQLERVREESAAVAMDIHKLGLALATKTALSKEGM